MNGGGQTRDGTPVMRTPAPTGATVIPPPPAGRLALWHKCEPLTDVPGGWALLCMSGHQLLERREFAPAAGESGEAVNARAHDAGWEWSAANGGEGRPDPSAPSPIDGWVRGMVETMNRISMDPQLRDALSRRGF